jgi:hypothetical protein
MRHPLPGVGLAFGLGSQVTVDDDGALLARVEWTTSDEEEETRSLPLRRATPRGVGTWTSHGRPTGQNDG